MLKKSFFKEYENMFMDREQEFLIDGFIEKNSLSLLVGPSNVGKTWVSYYLSYCVVDGKKFLGRECQKGTVYYFDKEMSDYQSYVRQTKFESETRRFAHITEDFPDILNDKEVEQFFVDIKDAVKNDDLKLVVIDSLNACCSTLDENNNSHMRHFMTFAKRLKNIVTTVIIHHKGKSENSEYRGASVIKDSCDNFFSIDKRGEISVLKQRFSNGKTFKISYDFEETDDSVTFTLKDSISKESYNLKQAVLDNLEDGMNQSKLREKLRQNNIAFINDELVLLLKTMNEIETVKGPKNSSLYFFKT